MAAREGSTFGPATAGFPQAPVPKEADCPLGAIH